MRPFSLFLQPAWAKNLRLPRMFSVLCFWMLMPSFLAIAAPTSCGHAENACADKPFVLRAFANRLSQIMHEGNYDLYMTGYAWHNRYTYPPEKIRTYNEMAWGGGLGKGLYDEYNNWHGMYAMAFLDSHKNIEPIGGYGYLRQIPLIKPFQLGLGYTLFISMRRDIWHNIPFPGILPLASLHYYGGTLFFTYIPGAHRAGNVLFIFGKWSLPWL